MKEVKKDYPLAVEQTSFLTLIGNILLASHCEAKIECNAAGTGRVELVLERCAYLGILLLQCNDFLAQQSRRSEDADSLVPGDELQTESVGNGSLNLGQMLLL